MYVLLKRVLQLHIARFEVLKQLEELEDKTVRRGVISNYPDDRIIND